MKTNTKKELNKKWFVIDAKEKSLGRLSVKAANLLRGKDKVDFAPHKDGGDFVVIINASLIAIDPKKLEGKKYHSHSGYPGGLKTRTLGEQMERDSRKVIEAAVAGMLPQNKLKAVWMRRLKVYTDGKHKHSQELIKVEV